MPFDCIVVGGGVVGLSAALALAKRGFSIALIEAQKRTLTTDASDLRVYAINRASQSLFQHLNLWEEIVSTGISPYRTMFVWDTVSKKHIEWTANLIAKSELGFIIKESVLKKALLIALEKNPHVHFFSETCITSMKEGPNITVGNATNSWQARFLLVADGRASPTRQLLGVTYKTWSYHQKALVASIHTEKPHQETAYQVFGPHGILAFLPLEHPHRCSIVWSASEKCAEELQLQSKEAFEKNLKYAFESKLGSLRLESPRILFPLHMRQSHKYAKDNWALMGDAAHTVHPLAGQGLNIGLQDVTSFLQHLDRLGCTKRMFAAYHRERKKEVWQTIFVLEGIKTFFSNRLPFFSPLRSLGLQCVNHLPFLKRFLIEEANR